MSSTVMLASTAAAGQVDLLGALLRGATSALAVAALLLAARRFGRDLAGLLAGMPTVTGPAMVWLALDRGHEFAVQAAHGAVAAAVPCALFALTYARLAPGHRRLAVLSWAFGASVLALGLLVRWHEPMTLTLAVVGAVCAACVAAMPQAVPRRLPRVSSPQRGAGALRAGLPTVLVSGAVTAVASLAAQALGPHWAGVLASPPVVAAAVAFELHRQGCPARVQDFLRGYTAGLFARSVSVAVFGTLLASRGMVSALSMAVLVALMLSWVTLLWMQRHHRLEPVGPGAP